MDGIRRSAVFAAVAIVAVTPHSMSGQETGDRLRVTLGASWVEGEAVRTWPDRLELAVAGGGSRVFRRDGITQVERIVRKSKAKRGFVIGGAVGWVLGGAMISMLASTSPNTLLTDHVRYWMAAGAVCGIPSGLIGALIGRMMVRVSVEPVPGWGGTAPGLLLGVQPGRQGGTSLLVGGRIR